MSNASQRLAQSRAAIVSQLRRGDRRPEAGSSARDQSSEQAGGRQAQGPGTWMDTAARALRAWWENHPAHLALELATPALTRYASEKPLQLVAIAVGVGALVAVARPWRLVSATGIALALLKSSQLQGTLMAFFAASHAPPPE